jgi:hypothetical protein
MKYKILFYFSLLFFLTSCRCCNKEETEPGSDRIYGINSNLFVNDLSYYSTQADTLVCKADMLGIKIKYKDSIIPNNNCRGKWVLENPPYDIHIFSDSIFLSKSPGKKLNEYFLCANYIYELPVDLTDQNFQKLSTSSFVLLLKPDIGVAPNTVMKFIAQIKLTDRTIYDTTSVVKFQ